MAGTSPSAVGIDIGGTRVKSVLIDHGGEVIRDDERDSVEGESAFVSLVEAVLSDHWNVFGTFEGVISGSRRAILTDLFGAGAYTRDRRLYGRVGVTYEFGRPIVGHRERDQPEPG